MNIKHWDSANMSGWWCRISLVSFRIYCLSSRMSRALKSFREPFPLILMTNFNAVFYRLKFNIYGLPTGNPCRYVSGNKSFIYSLHNINGYSPVKLTQSGYSNLIMWDCSNSGPSFGGGDIILASDAVNNNESYTHCGHTYTAPPGYTHADCPFFAGSFRFSPTNIEVFYEKLP